MSFARIVDVTKATDLAERARVADRFFARAWGLMGREVLAPGEGLVIVPCRSVHMAFMRFALDIVFLDRRGDVCRVMNLRPWGFSPVVRTARTVLELPEGTIARARVEVGDRIDIVEGPDEA